MTKKRLCKTNLHMHNKNNLQSHPITNLSRLLYDIFTDFYKFEVRRDDLKH